MAAMLKQVLAGIATCDEKIDVLVRAHPDYALVQFLKVSIPSTWGIVITPALGH